MLKLPHAVAARSRRKSAKIIYVLVASVLIAIAALATGPSSTAKAHPPAAGLEATEVLTNLNTPSNFAFDGKGRIYVSERYGIVRRYTPGQESTPRTVVDVREEVFRQGDRGLLGLALDPKFDSGRPFIYLLYTYDKDPFGSSNVPRWGGKSKEDACEIKEENTKNNKDGCAASGRLVRYAVSESGKADVSTKKVLLDGSTDPKGGWCSQFTSHGNSTLVFGRDGQLYVGAGDGASFFKTDWGQNGGGTSPVNACNDRSASAPQGRGTAPAKSDSKGGALRSQAARASNGKDYVTWDGAILRINPNDGKAPRDNPLVDNGIDGDDRIVAYGLRNPYKFNFRPGSDELWIGDIGWSTKEEINTFRTGPNQSSVPNFGWPCYEGSQQQRGGDGKWGYANENLGMCQSLYEQPKQSLGGVSSPLVKPYFEWTRKAPMADNCKANGKAAVSAGAFATNSAWPQNLRGSYVFADMAQSCLAVMPLKDGRPDRNAVAMILPDFRATAIQRGPGGDIYAISGPTGSLIKIGPASDGNANNEIVMKTQEAPKQQVDPNKPPILAKVSALETEISRPGEGESYAIVEATIDNANAVDKVTVTLGEGAAQRSVDMKRKSDEEPDVYRGYVTIDPELQAGRYATKVLLVDTAGNQSEKVGPSVTLRN